MVCKQFRTRLPDKISENALRTRLSSLAPFAAVCFTSRAVWPRHEGASRTLPLRTVSSSLSCLSFGGLFSGSHCYKPKTQKNWTYSEFFDLWKKIENIWDAASWSVLFNFTEILLHFRKHLSSVVNLSWSAWAREGLQAGSRTTLSVKVYPRLCIPGSWKNSSPADQD